MIHILNYTFDIFAYGVSTPLFDFFFYAIFGLSALASIGFIIRYIIRGYK